MADGAFKDWVTGELSAAGALTGAEVFWLSQGGASKSADLDTIAAYIGSGATGDVVGPASATDNAIVRFDSTTGKLIQNSVVTIADTSGNMAGVGTLASGTHTITSTSASALTVGRQGATDPVLTVDANTGTVVTGIKLTGAAAAGGFDMTVTSSGTDENLTINAKGTGTITFGNNSTGNIVLSRNTTLAGTYTITSANSAAFTVGRLGATTPAFKVDASTGTSITGITIKSAATGGGVSITATGSATESITYSTAGSANHIFQTNSVTRFTLAGSTQTWVPSIKTGTAGATWTWTGNTNSTLVTASNVRSVLWNMAATQSFDAGAKTLQTDFAILGTSYLAGGATTVTDGATFHVDGAPIASTNITITNASTFYSEGRNVTSGATNSYGLNIKANTGATNNYAFRFEGSAGELINLSTAGKISLLKTNTAGGTTGAQTIDKPSGTVNFAAAASTLVVTNALCTTSSLIFAEVRTDDTTSQIKNVVPGSGSFTITLNAAATAETSVGFIIVN